MAPLAQRRAAVLGVQKPSERGWGPDCRRGDDWARFLTSLPHRLLLSPTWTVVWGAWGAAHRGLPTGPAQRVQRLLLLSVVRALLKGDMSAQGREGSHFTKSPRVCVKVYLHGWHYWELFIQGETEAQTAWSGAMGGWEHG